MAIGDHFQSPGLTERFVLRIPPEVIFSRVGFARLVRDKVRRRRKGGTHMKELQDLCLEVVSDAHSLHTVHPCHYLNDLTGCGQLLLFPAVLHDRVLPAAAGERGGDGGLTDWQGVRRISRSCFGWAHR
jgi:hypothetical protein